MSARMPCSKTGLGRVHSSLPAPSYIASAASPTSATPMIRSVAAATPVNAGIEPSVRSHLVEPNWSGQAPQWSVPPHPSGTSPQDVPHVLGTQLPLPHTFATPPPPHVCPAGHVPQ